MYKRRLIDSQLEYFKTTRYALLIEGAKATGKTTTCKNLTEHHFRLDHKEERELVENSNHRILFEESGDILIDEWQFLPDVWNTVRRKIDDGDFDGTIFLTGSSPSLQTKIHSGSGRILRFKMRPLSVEERGMDVPKIRISKLLSLEIEDDLFFRTGTILEDYLDEIFLSGFPGFRQESDTVRKRSFASYIDNITHHDFGDDSNVIRKPAAMKAWLRSYAAAIATTATSKTIADAAFSDNEESLSTVTLQNYRDLLSGIGITEEVPAWVPIGQLFKNLSRTSKHFLVDPALSVNLLDLSKRNLLLGRQIPKTVGKLNKTFLGQLFESLVYQSLAVYCDINDATLSHLRIRGGEKEIDFIIQKEGVLIAVEVKSKLSISDKDVANLNWFEKKIGEEYDVIKLVISVGTHSYQREDGVIICPLSLLGC